MIAETASRFSESQVEGLSFGGVKVVGSQKHQALLSRILPNAQLILEPFGRNSAPAVAAVCLACNPDELVLILPADHSIRDVGSFHAAIEKGLPAATAGNIVTYGLEPHFPATGYGYIQSVASEAAVREVSAFVEKPEQATAEAYLTEGNYFWNAGIFLFKASVMLDAFLSYAPEILPPVIAALGSKSGQVNHLEADAFAKAPDISIDYAIMEHAQNVKVVPVEMGWSDVGDYQALYELFREAESSVVAQGPTLVLNSSNIYANSQGPVIAMKGVEDLTIVATPDTVMVTKAGDSDSVKVLGKQVQANRARLGLQEQFVSEVREWLWGVFDYWADRVWDEEAGGFVEQVSFEGKADLGSPRRVRVQARQTFSFARALQYGWTNQSHAERMVKLGIDYIDKKLRHPDGGWIHTFDRNAVPIDSKRDLYDHAFIVLAGAAAFEATGNEKALAIAYDALAFVNGSLKDDNVAGWLEGIPAALPRRANPHMHLLEATSALYRATKDKSVLKVARECVALFETYFFVPSVDIMAEFFANDWSPISRDNETVFEIGHMYEWATLLHEYDKLTGHDSLSWRRRMIQSADTYVKVTGTGFATNAQRIDGKVVDPRRRLWPQLEMFRAHVLHPEIAPNGTPEGLFRLIKSHYIDTMPEGLWMDEFDENGQPYSKAVPASILYHFITAFSPLID